MWDSSESDLIDPNRDVACPTGAIFIPGGPANRYAALTIPRRSSGIPISIALATSINLPLATL